jgi:S-adenosylmethionine decarboxylase
MSELLERPIEDMAEKVLARVDGKLAAGRHVLLDLWGCQGLGDLEHVRNTLRAAAIATGATILADSFHHFGQGMGVSGTLLLAESHASIHTWPEIGHATIDMFTCGDCDPQLAVPTLVSGFEARKEKIISIIRGEWSERP